MYNLFYTELMGFVEIKYMIHCILQKRIISLIITDRYILYGLNVFEQNLFNDHIYYWCTLGKFYKKMYKIDFYCMSVSGEKSVYIRGDNSEYQNLFLTYQGLELRLSHCYNQQV